MCREARAIVIEDRHAESARAVRHGATDTAHADDAHRLARDLDAEALEEAIPDLPGTIHVADMLLGAPRSAEKQKHVRVGCRVGEHIRRVADHDATRVGCSDIDVVIADTGGGDHLHAGRQSGDVVSADRHAERHKQAVRLMQVRERDHLVCSEMPFRGDAVEQRVNPIPQAWRDRKRYDDAGARRHHLPARSPSGSSCRMLRR